MANQAYSMAIQENGGVRLDDSVLKFEALKSQMKIIAEYSYGTGSQGKCWATSGVGPKDYIVTSCVRLSNGGQQNTNSAFTTTDGMFWMLYTYNPCTTANPWLFIDVNGDKGPNDWGKNVYLLKMLDTAIVPWVGCSGLKHNDGTSVIGQAEFLDSFLK